MADAWRLIEQELSDGQPAAGRPRGLVITSIVAIPIASESGSASCDVVVSFRLVDATVVSLLIVIAAP
jgi:hypothetical protein